MLFCQVVWPKVSYWTDSENVYYWVRNQSREFKPFVANRIAEIQRSTNPEQWRHVPGMDNPADLPTRGLSATNLSENRFWMEGPSFLKEDETTWPSKPSKEVDKSDDCERRSTVKTYATKDCNQCVSIDPTKFSSLDVCIVRQDGLSVLLPIVRFVERQGEILKGHFLLLKSLMSKHFGSNTSKQSLFLMV